MGIEQLPDDALVAVMQFLSVPDVLACRLVCKRLCDLVSYRDVWRHLVLYTNYAPPAPVCATLRLAPCLKKMHLRLPWDACDALYVTRCAVAELRLIVGDGDAAMQAAFAIRHQSALGRLNRIEVVINFLCSEVSTLLEVLASTSGLKELKVRSVRDKEEPSFFHSTVCTASSLVCFECDPIFENFCKKMITGHRTTLEEIKLPFRSDRSIPSASLVALVAGLPNLRRFQCPLIPGLAALVGCASLRSLALHVETTRRQLLQEAADCLRRATQLRQVWLRQVCGYRDARDPPGERGVELLLQSLVSSGKSSLEDLTITAYNEFEDDEDDSDCEYYKKDFCDINFEVLLGALPSLPALRRLEMDVPSEKLLPCLTPVVAPALRSVLLHRRTPLESEPLPPCVHDWVHSDEVRSALSHNPLLHIKLHTSFPAFDSMMEECPMHLHEELRMVDNGGVFSHDPGEKCSVDHNLNKDDDCIWVHVRV